MDIERLGKYEIRGTLGKGAMGTVYAGWDPVISRKVAIKTVPLPDPADIQAQDELSRFKREAQAAGRLNHPNIVGVFDYGETDTIAYIVMEYVDGTTLKALIDAGERLALPQVGRVMADVLAGLAFSHERGVIHRDIKPANIMIANAEGQGGGTAKIADFGIARIESSNMTQAGTIMGTPAYMSPEQFMGQTVDARTDIYSAGVMLFQLLTGERPFEGSMATIMHKALNTQPPKPSDLSVTAPVSLDPVVFRAMAKRPEERFATAAEFGAALQAALSAPIGAMPAGLGDLLDGCESTIVARPSPRPVGAAAAPPPAAKPKSRGPLIAAAAVAVLALAGGGAWFAFSGPATPPNPQIGNLPASGSGAALTRVEPPLPSPPAEPPQTPPAQSFAETTAPAPVPPPPAPMPQVTQVVPPQAPASKRNAPPVLPPAIPAETTPPPTAALVPALPQLQAPAPGPSAVPPSSQVATVVPPAPAQAPITAQMPVRAPQPTPTPQAQPLPPAEPILPQRPVAAPSNQLASAALTPEALRRAVATAVAGVNCAVIGGDAARGAVSITGAIGSGPPEQDLQRALRDATQGAAIDWKLGVLTGPYCGVLDVLRAHARPFGATGPTLQLATKDGRTSYQTDDLLSFRAIMPDYSSYLQIDYFQSNGTVSHVTTAAAGTPVLLAGTVKDQVAGDVGDPYGTDLVVAIASSSALFAKKYGDNPEQTDEYLRALHTALDAATRRGARLSIAVLVLQTAARP